MYGGAPLLTEPWRSVHVIAIGDIGVADGMMHIGDEAMFEALLDELRAARRDIDHRAERGAGGVGGALRHRGHRPHRLPGGSAAGAAGSRRCSMPSRARDACRAGDPFWTVRDAVASADGVVIAGGGNLASTWPLHIFERSALARIAAHLGKPLVITGQTLGPALSAEDRPILAQTLASARLVGLRERPPVSSPPRSGWRSEPAP